MAYIKNNSHDFSGAYQYIADDNDASDGYLNSRTKYILPYLERCKKILELGCGEGLLGERLKNKHDISMYGIDISLSGVAIAKKRGVKAIVGDLNNKLPYKDNTFDMIYSDQLLEHIYKTDHLFDETYRVLKPNGILITITPNISFWLNRILFLFGIYPIFAEVSEKTKVYGTKWLKPFIKDKESVGHIRVFNLASLIDILQNHRFRIQKVRGIPRGWDFQGLTEIIYNFFDSLFAQFPALARDIIVIAIK